MSERVISDRWTGTDAIEEVRMEIRTEREQGEVVDVAPKDDRTDGDFDKSELVRLKGENRRLSEKLAEMRALLKLREDELKAAGARLTVANERFDQVYRTTVQLGERLDRANGHYQSILANTTALLASIGRSIPDMQFKITGTDVGPLSPNGGGSDGAD